MIEYLTGNIFDADVEAVVNTVNCVGVMGKGIALQCKELYPDNFKCYAKACKESKVVQGKMFVYETQLLAGPRYIINFPTKRHWRNPSLLEDIESGLDDLVEVIERYKISSIAIPPLGAGLGGLAWRVVKRLIEAKLSVLPGVSILVYEPSVGVVIDVPVMRKATAQMTSGRAALIMMMNAYASGSFDTLTLIEVHKLSFFLQEAGQPLKLKFQKAYYGPYAENLRFVLAEMEGTYISGYEGKLEGDTPDMPIELMSNAVREAAEFLKVTQEVNPFLAKVLALVRGFETAYGLELLSTVHWCAKNEQYHTLESIVKAVHAWNSRKQMFTAYEIEQAHKRLKTQGWC